jgi:S-DNA-T family DNA segregation ATPase FtsK/SpoIIIE
VSSPAPDVLRVSAPPGAVGDGAGGLGAALAGGLGSLGMLGFAVMGGRLAYLLIAGGLALLTLGMSVGGRILLRRRARRAALRLRARWQAHLADRVQTAARAARQQRAALEAVHPPTHAALMTRAAGGSGLWERRPADQDAWRLRVGRGPVPSAVRLVADGLDAPATEPDPELAGEAAAAVRAAAAVADAPVVVDLARGPLVVLGPREQGRRLVRALLAELAVARPPEELHVVVCADADPADWAWLRWLPHAHDPLEVDGTASLYAGGREEFLALTSRLDGPGVRVVDLESGRARELAATPELGALAQEPGVGMVWLAESESDLPPTAASRVLIEPGGGGVVQDEHGRTPLTSVGGLSAVEAEAVARALCPRRLGERAAELDDPAGVRLAPLLGVDCERHDARAGWAVHPPSQRLSVPVGRDPHGAPVLLDLREAAEGGMGPHGLVVGATGSGKSELLRALVTGLVVRHSPAQLAFVLVDFKGGAAFDDVAGVPHVAGLVTNLAEDSALVDRVCRALTGELERRQQLLRHAGCESLRDYRERGLSPDVPSLVVAIDEFGELLAAHPEALETLVQIGRLGRSLGVHLILASQRLDEGRLRGLEAHLRWRLCLRTFTAAESTAVLGVPDAARLSAVPGTGLLAVDGELRPLRAAHASAPAAPASGARPPLVRPLRLGPRAVSAPGPAVRRAERSERRVLVQAVLDAGAPVTAPVWLPPLPARVAVDHLQDSMIGVIDRPERQGQEPLCIDPWRSGPIGVVGAPRAGVSGALLGLTAAALLGDASRTAVVLAFGGSGLRPLLGLPQVVATVTPDHGADHAATVLAAVVAAAEGRAGPLGHGPLLVVADGLARARERVDGLDEALARVAASGPGAGVVLAVGGHRWSDLRAGLRDLVPTRLELRLADAGDSQHPRGLASLLRAAPPGRCLTPDGALAQLAVPGTDLIDTLGARAPAGPALRPLPDVHAVPACAPGLGLRAGDLRPVVWSPEMGHLLVAGDRGSGRSTLLRRIIRQASSAGWRTVVVDPRRALLEVAELAGVAWSRGGADCAVALSALAEELAVRLDGAAHSRPAYARPAGSAGPRSRGPRGHLVVVDDADRLPGSLASPLSPLADLLRHGPDLALALVLARPVTGLLRAAYDPVLQALRDTSPTTVLLPGDPDEGPVAGQLRAQPGPPGRARLVVPGAAPVVLQLHAEPDEVVVPLDRSRRASA